jgi:hypothetical protein
MYCKSLDKPGKPGRPHDFISVEEPKVAAPNVEAPNFEALKTTPPATTAEPAASGEKNKLIYKVLHEEGVIPQ